MKRGAAASAAGGVPQGLRRRRADVPPGRSAAMKRGVRAQGGMSVGFGGYAESGRAAHRRRRQHGARARARRTCGRRAGAQDDHRSGATSFPIAVSPLKAGSGAEHDGAPSPTSSSRTSSSRDSSRSSIETPTSRTRRARGHGRHDRLPRLVDDRRPGPGQGNRRAGRRGRGRRGAALRRRRREADRRQALSRRHRRAPALAHRFADEIMQVLTGERGPLRVASRVSRRAGAVASRRSTRCRPTPAICAP